MACPYESPRMNLGSSSNTYQKRRERLLALLEERRLTGLVVTKPVNIFYLIGFRGSAGVAVVSSSGTRLFVDPRYTLQAREQAPGVEVVEERGGLLKAVGRWLRKKEFRGFGVEDFSLTCHERSLLDQEASNAVRLRPAGELIEEMRTIKDPEEIACIRKAAQITDEAFREVLPMARPGAREADLAAEIEYRMRRKGAQGAAFDTIVASGYRGALPHATASAKALQRGELVIFDLGAILAGYAADMTRTVHLGRPPQQVRRYYEAVREAQEEAVAAVRPGRRCSEVDRVARRALARRGLGRYFTHSTGHGVGLEIHEKPRLARNEKVRLEAGCVVTAEPGIYIEGFGGVRIEDTVLVVPEGAEVLPTISKAEWVLD